MRDDDAMSMTGSAATEAGGRFNPRLLLTVFVRLLALVFLASGLLEWAIILGPAAPDSGFLSLPVEFKVATVFFAVCNLVAAVGLWLLASWGAVVWLIAALTESALHGLFPETFGFAWLTVGFHVGSIVVYAVFTYLVDRSSEES